MEMAQILFLNCQQKLTITKPKYFYRINLSKTRAEQKSLSSFILGIDN
jgi:hypothetical protein